MSKEERLDVDQPTRKIHIRARDAYPAQDETITIDGPDGRPVSIAVHQTADATLYRLLDETGEPTGPARVRNHNTVDEDTFLGDMVGHPVEDKISRTDQGLVTTLQQQGDVLPTVRVVAPEELSVPERLINQVNRAAEAPTAVIGRVTDEPDTTPIPAIQQPAAQPEEPERRMGLGRRIADGLHARRERKEMVAKRQRVVLGPKGHQPPRGRLRG